MNLKDYIASMGDKAFAKQHGVTERCARSWRTGWRSPKPSKAVEIAEKSGGKLSMVDVYAS